ncbi:hypothetical protein [Cloacibacillus sp.]|uniref:hypothetical protein n=1 Tax=Cloacibacillus sp. TaxID=2049023 RepID=UPI0025C04B36|nr:hypothetical protein [Cloacibacillus sp.]MCC8057657.1 hypothetical protein [Cloacibacillus sp.]
MTGKAKYAVVTAVAAVIVAALFFTYTLWNSSGILTMIPRPEESRPYVLTETKEGSYPKALSALLTDGVYALLKDGTPRNALLTAASAAKEAALLVEDGGGGMTEVYASFRFAPSDTAGLKKGLLPDILKVVFKEASVRAGSERGVFVIESEGLSSPVYYTVKGKNVVMAAELSVLRRMEEASKKSSANLGGKKWNQEKSCPAHIEISDGGAITANAEHKFPITVEAAWRSLDPKSPSDPAGEIRWALVNLGKPVEAYLSSTLKARKWDTADCIIPEPLLLSMGIDLPPLGGDPKDWPFPLSSLGEIAENLDMKDDQIREILSGQTVFSLGGQNRILWFSLPGFLVEFSGRSALMSELVDSFWKNLFFGAEPKPLPGFTFGGTTNVPFSVIGAGRDGIAVLGLTTPQSINAKNRLGKFLKDDESVVGWMLADLPRIGGALSEMTKMSSFLGEESAEDAEPYDDGDSGYGEEEPLAEPLQPELSLSPFDQGITDSFGNVLKRLGRVLIVWETPLSGRINWYKTAAK